MGVLGPNEAGLGKPTDPTGAGVPAAPAAPPGHAGYIETVGQAGVGAPEDK